MRDGITKVITERKSSEKNKVLLLMAPPSIYALTTAAV